MSYSGFTYKHTLTITEEMHKRLEAERKRRCLGTIPETIRAILSEYVSTHKIEEPQHEPPSVKF
jgi:hypothetical protein